MSLICLLFITQLFAEDCRFRAHSLVTVESAVNCLRHLPYKNFPKEVNQTLEALESFFDQYAYRDTTADIPDPFKKDKFDIVKALNEIKGTTFNDGFEFHQSIANAVTKLNDAHTAYHYPCSNAFAYVFPYNFELQAPNPSNPNNVNVVVKKSVVGGVTEAFISGGGPDIVGKTVTTLILPDISANASETPANTIARWSREHVSLSRTPAAKLNYALDGQFALRMPSLSPPPEPVSMRVMNGSKQLTLKIPFFALPLVDSTNVTDFFNKVCPSRSSKIEDEKDLFTLDVKEPEEEFDQIMKEHSEDEAFTMVYDRLKHDDELKRMIEAQRRMSFELERDVLKQIHHLKKLGKIRSEADDTRDLLEIARKATGQSSDGDMLPSMEVLSTDENLCTGLIHDWKLGVCHIKSFSPESDYLLTNWVKGIVNVLVKAKKAGYKMIFDVRGNGGGIVFLGAQLYHLLFPNMFPIIPKYSFVEGPANNMLFRSMHGDDSYTVITEYTTLKPIPDLLKLPARKIRRNTLTGQREQNWTQQYAMNSDRYFDILFSPFLPAEYRNKQMFDANDLLFITDGECGSTCSQFLKHVKETQQAKVIGLGGALNQQTMPYDIASFAAGNVISSSTFDGYNIQGVKKFPRYGTSLSYVMNTGYSFDWKTPDEELEYKIIQPDEVYPLYPKVETQFTEEGYVSVAQAVKYMFEKCFSFQVAENDNCTAPSGQHKIYGSPCVNGAFDYSKCVFRRCEDGYYLDANNACVKTPKISPKSSFSDESLDGAQNTKEKSEQKQNQKQSEGKELHFGVIGAISVGCVCGTLAIIGAAVVVAVMVKKRRTQKKVLPEEQPLNP
ncbi:putative Peptidase family S41 member [Monocercomonoides exilis]|uniref:putative Peptidase family S41 member n=1 Tax=Monocercomonoides exilis TaxID=2049356 RepID=UPI00355A2B6A|nr:putative Peptidase family S41 member [Monocercomonoides exilis]|eukprot:MONOS_2882.1-p1 / transcript=MONOS_2882.1 / gene=MONOS_2882 / organism=Monocercomonoides_exilis_PA203 / gene_product=Peptidase family S41 member / transcript_product=Peptidase family S41 member / location=Mono_scaffold00062:139800-142387(-) / protein_length=839 / sequence_SO=supercontig / SO=protein_coding / is_pseudo=false